MATAAICNTELETSSQRVLRTVATGVLSVVALAVALDATVMCFGPGSSRRFGDTVFACIAYILLGAAVSGFRRSLSGMRVVQVAGAAGFLALFFTSFSGGRGAVVEGMQLFDPTLWLAAALFASIVLASWLRRTGARAPCNCGH